MDGEASKIEKEISGKGPMEKLPPAKSKGLDSEAPVKVKDAGVYKPFEKKGE